MLRHLDRDPLPTLAWQIDGGDWQEDEVASQVTLARGMPAGRHRLLLMARGLDETQGRWTPPLAASLAFLGFEVTEGALQPSPRGAGLEIEFLGDSVTEGVAVLPPRAGRDSRTWRADARLAYPCQTALRLGAEWRQVGFGRQGITVGGSGGVPRAADAFAWIYAGVPRDGWQPDLVVVNQGTNDRDAPAAELRRGYERYLATIRSGYPRAGIAALRPFGGAQAAEIRAAVEARNAER